MNTTGKQPGFLHYFRQELARARSAEEIAAGNDLVDRIRAAMLSFTPAVLGFCEVVIVASLLFAADKFATGVDSVLVRAISVGLGVAVWGHLMAMWRPVAGTRRSLDLVSWKQLGRMAGTLAITVIIFWVGYRMSLVAKTVQFGSKIPEPALVKSEPSIRPPAPSLQLPDAAKLPPAVNAPPQPSPQ
jgi:hypothetical protein